PRVWMRPWTAPISVVSASTPTRALGPIAGRARAVSTEASEATAVIDRSMPPSRITTVCAVARIKMTLDSSASTLRAYGDRNDGSIAPTAINRLSRTTSGTNRFAAQPARGRNTWSSGGITGLWFVGGAGAISGYAP